MAKFHSLPTRARMAIDTRDGAMDLYEADRPIFINVIQEDIDTAVCNDPKRCVAANSAIRMYGALAVDFHRTVAYIVWPGGKGPFKALRRDYAVRYTMPSHTMKQIASFDAGKDVFPCQVDFLAVTPGRTLAYRREAVKKSNEAKRHKTIQPKSTAGPRGGHHYITGFIGSKAL